MKFAADVRYANNHEWIKKDGNEYIVGISDFAQDELGDIVFVELPEAGETILEGKAFGVVESVKTASDIYMPVSATIVAVNEKLRDKPELINESPYGEGWIVRVQVKNTEAIDSLMNVDDYKKMVDA